MGGGDARPGGEGGVRMRREGDCDSPPVTQHPFYLPSPNLSPSSGLGGRRDT